MALIPTSRPLFESGFRLHSGDALNKILGSLYGVKSTVTNGADNTFGSNLLLSSVAAVTAHSGGTQALATPLTADINAVTTVAAAGDSVALPLGVAGMNITISNQTATNNLDVYVANGSTDTINAIATGTAFVIAATKTTTFYCAGVTSGVGIWVAQAAS